MPDSNNTENLEQLVIEARALIPSEVQYACRKYNHGAPPEEVEELSAQILLLLLEHDYRRLKTYDCQKAKLKTWLRQVIRHEVSHHYQKQPSQEPIDDVSSEAISYAPMQEAELLSKEQQVLLYEAIRTLTPHDQQLADLKLNAATDEEIAQAMQITPRSVQQEWSKIGKRLKAMFEKKGGPNPVPR